MRSSQQQSQAIVEEVGRAVALIAIECNFPLTSGALLALLSKACNAGVSIGLDIAQEIIREPRLVIDNTVKPCATP